MIYFILHIFFKEEEASSKLVGCIKESVERLEDVLQQVQCEINGVQEKMEDIKIEVKQISFLCHHYDVQVAGIATGLEDLWRIKNEVANIASIMK